MLKYFISKEFLITLVGLGILGLIAYLLIFFLFLPIYTRHGDALLVPDVYELSLDEATAALEKAKLQVEVRDSAYYDDIPPLTVVSQYPVALSRVKPKRKVYLTVNKKLPPMVKVPDIEGYTLYQAKSRLESWKLAIGTVTEVPDIAENVVLGIKFKRKDIEAGVEVPQGSQIDVTIGSGFGGRGKNIEIPNLEGLTYEEALVVLRQYNLGLGSVVYNPDGPEEMMGQVYNQRPRPALGDSIRIGRPVDIFVYGEEPEENEGIDVEVLDNN